jgi:hypothetical protein
MKQTFSPAITLLLALLISSQSFALGSGYNDPGSPKGSKSTMKTTAQPDIPGALVIEIANNILMDAPGQMALEWYGSWTVNLYYMYDFPIGNSKFSMSTGIGLGLEKYSFEEDITLVTNADDSQTSIELLENILPNASSFKKSKFATNYVDIPLEFRFYADKENKRKSVKAAVGGKFGIRYEVKTKVKYEENNQTKKYKWFENYNVPNFRYGVYGRLGVSGVSLYYYYSLSEMFENKKGPEETRANVMMVGVSLSGF